MELVRDRARASTDTRRSLEGAELVVVLGGDGTFLRAAEFARPARAPLVGVNLGLVGLPAEIEPDALPDTVQHIVTRSYTVEERLTLDVDVILDGRIVASDWALNEASVEKTKRERMLEVRLDIDGRPLTSFGCDGVVCASPTGSTAYAFSSGGPVAWPEVQALLVVPTSAHALFARPLVIAPEATVTIMVEDGTHDGVLGCDGWRTSPVPAGARVEVRRARCRCGSHGPTRGRSPSGLSRSSACPWTASVLSPAGW